MRYSLIGGGKRLRPVSVSPPATRSAAIRPMAMPTACAIELIHTYSLIHDDLPAMDNDTLRRGRPTLHVVAGEGMAILAGDGLLTEAFTLMAREPRDRRAGARGAQARVIRFDRRGGRAAGMVGGQAIDLACVTPDPQRPAVGAPRCGRRCGACTARRPARSFVRRRPPARSWAEARSTGRGDRRATLTNSASPFRSSTTSSTSKAPQPTSARPPGRTPPLASRPIPRFSASTRQSAWRWNAWPGAESALGTVSLADSHLMGIGRWIVERRN